MNMTLKSKTFCWRKFCEEDNLELNVQKHYTCVHVDKINTVFNDSCADRIL